MLGIIYVPIFFHLIYVLCNSYSSGKMTTPYSLTLLPRVPSLLSTKVKVLTMESRDLGCMPLWI